MNNKMMFKEEGTVVEKFRDFSLEEEVKKNSCHLCSDCVNGYPSICPKVADVRKKDLEEYDFIKKGYQTFDDDGDLNTFVVLECEKFKKSSDTKRNASKKYYKDLKKKIIATYFEVGTAEEAYLLQAEMVERGHLKINKDQLPNEKTLDMMRQRIRK